MRQQQERQYKPNSREIFSADIESLSQDGRGIARIDGKTVFIRGALPGETVEFYYTKLFSRFDEGQAVAIENPAANRVTPECAHVQTCGGCNLQHLDSSTQIETKQGVLLEQLKHFGNVESLEILPPLTGPSYGYRRKARLGARYVKAKDEILVGFREAHNPRFLANIDSCAILDPRVGQLIAPLKQLIQSLTVYQDIPQIEVAIGDEDVALVFRHLQPLSADDNQKLCNFGEAHNLRIFVQPNKISSIRLLWPQDDRNLMTYTLADYDITFSFHPADFTQVNIDINSKMVKRACELLDLQKDDHVFDLFCGLGNFSLPMAKQVAHVTGIEGDNRMVQRATENAKRNNIENCSFFSADLYDDISHYTWARGKYTKILLDPPRSGALEVLPLIAKFKASHIVYVSCNPATLARDAGDLVDNCGYKLSKVGVMDMFPHTRHVEAIALFTRDK